MNRYDARENAFKLVFSAYFQKDTDIGEISETYLQSSEIESDEYFEQLINVVYDNLGEIDGLIEANLNNWTLARISKVALAALRIGVAELNYIDETPANVAINEAVELAKKFEDKKCGQFVNGVLSAVQAKL